MKDTLAGAIKALVEKAFTPAGGSPQLFVYRTKHTQDEPLDRVYPYAVVKEGISRVPDVSNPDDGSDQPGIFELVQLDLWQRWKDVSTNTTTEDVALPDLMYLALSGASLSLAPNRVYGMHVLNAVRLDDEDSNLIHDAFTLQVARSLTRRV